MVIGVALLALAAAGAVVVSNAGKIDRPRPDITLDKPSADAEWRGFRSSMTRRLASAQTRVSVVRRRLAAQGSTNPAAESLLVLSAAMLDSLGRGVGALDTVTRPDHRRAVRAEVRARYEVLRELIKRARSAAGYDEAIDEDSLDRELKDLIGD
ncbi:MAG: hypothetical protein R6X13_11705 [bacterium]